MRGNEVHPLISVIIPVYNVEKYLARCLDSIIYQAYSNLEIILVDDGSPDNSGKICDDYAEKDNRVRVIHKENGGVSSARNIGIEVAKGDYITFVDSDDYILDNHFLQFVKSEKNSNDMVISSFIVKRGDVIHRINYDYRDLVLSKCTNDEEIILFDPSMCYVWNKFYKKNIIDAQHIRFDEGVGFGEDTIFIYTYLKHCKQVRYIEGATYCYEDKESTATKRYWEDLLIYLKKEILVYNEFLSVLDATEVVKKEVLGFYSTRFFRLWVNRHITKKSFFRFVKEYSVAYKYFSPYFSKSTKIKGENIDADERVMLKRGKWRYLFFVAGRILKQHFRNRKTKV